MKRFFVFSLILLTACSLVFAGGSSSSSSVKVLRMGDNSPDRNSGYGAALDKINAEFEAANPGVLLQVESLRDQPWQDKVMVYANAKILPDVFTYWTFPNMMLPLVNAGLLEPLNKSDLASAGFLPGSLEASEYNGKIYGIPKSADTWVLFVNKDLFQKAGVPIPTSWEDIVASVPKFKAINVAPITTNGMDGWPLAILFHNLVERFSGDFTMVTKAVSRQGGVKFTDAGFVQAAKYIQDLVKAGVFSSDMMTSDYDAGKNGFTQGRSAMYMMGPWEMGMETDTSLTQAFRSNLDVIGIPVVAGGKGKVTDIMAWYGGNIVIASSKNKDLAASYIKFLAQRWGSYIWEAGALPAQKVSPRASDGPVARKILQVVGDATATSGTTVNDLGNSVFKGDCEELVRQLFSLLITPEQFCQRLDASAQTNAGK